MKLFFEGYNCAQAVTMTFSDLIGIEEKRCAKMVVTAVRIMEEYIAEHSV